MGKKVSALLIIVFLVITSITACGGDGKKGETQSQSSQTNAIDKQKYYETMDEEQLDREIQKMEDEGILDENGQPAPGVDLNDYPGLG